jgi:hypothetical protein
MSLPALPSIPSFPVPCSFLYSNVGISLYYKDKTAFITGATVTFEKWPLSPTYATSTGVLYYACLLTGEGIDVYAQKSGVDFGAGVGAKALVGGASLIDRGFGDYRIPSFEARTPFPCPSITPIISASNFSSTLPTAIPNVTVLPMSGYIPDIGSVSVTEGTYEIWLDDTMIISSNVPSSGKIDYNLPSISNIPSLVGKTSTTVKVVVKWYHCTFTGTTTVSLPPIAPPCVGAFLASLPNINDILSKTSVIPTSIYVPVTVSGVSGNVPADILVDGKTVSSISPTIYGFDIINVFTTANVNTNSSHRITIHSTRSGCSIPDLDLSIPPLIPAIPICYPPQIYNPVTGRCETPIPTCYPPEVYNPVTGKCETPIPTCYPPQVYNPVTGRCETPIPTCTLPQVYNPVTGRCETPACADLRTTVESVDHPSTLPSTPSLPFYISINKIKAECPSNIALTERISGEIGTVTLGSLSAQFPIPSIGQSSGEVYFDLSKLVDMSQIIGGTPVIPAPTQATTVPAPTVPTVPIVPAPTVPTVPTTPQYECTKSGKLGVPGVFYVGLTEVQNYLNNCFPGGIAEAGTGSWMGSYKITRSSGGKYPSGTYFWTTTWEDIRRLY